WVSCQVCGSGGTGRRARLRILWGNTRGGSSPLSRTKISPRNFGLAVLAYLCSATTSCRPYFVNHIRIIHPSSSTNGNNPSTNQIVAPRHSTGNTFCCPRKNDPVAIKNENVIRH